MAGVDFEVKEPEAGAISSIVYSPVQEQKADFLFWCESCSQILEVCPGANHIDCKSFARASFENPHDESD